MTSQVSFTSPTPQLTKKGEHHYIVHGSATYIPEDRIGHWRDYMNRADNEWNSLDDSRPEEFTLIEDYYGNA